MNSLVGLLRFVSALSVLIVSVAGCESDDGKRNAELHYLIPELRTDAVISLTLNSEEGRSQLVKTQGAWWLQPPVDYLADQQAVESFLRILADAEVGKTLKVADADLKQLQLASGDGIGIHLMYSSGRQTRLIIGGLDFPEDWHAGIWLQCSSICAFA